MLRRKREQRIRASDFRKRKNWRYGLIPLSLLIAIGILALDRGEGAVRRLAWLLDPVYSYGVKSYAMGWQDIGSGRGIGNAGGNVWNGGRYDLYDGGAGLNGRNSGDPFDVNLSGQVEIVYGDNYLEEAGGTFRQNTVEGNRKKIENLWEGKDFTYLIQNFYIVNPSTYVSEDIFPVEELLNMDLSIVKDSDNPQILIHHTHGSEAFLDSRAGAQEDTVIGMGIELARLLSEEYGFQVIHDRTAYDQVNGKLDRNRAYDCAREGTEAILAEYPSIQVIIDLHRDGGPKRVTGIDGKNTAQVMFFNGLSRNMNGPITYLYNPYLKENLAFSLQMKLAAMEHWPDFAKPVFLKGYEYNLSMMPRSLLIEVGTEQNTVAEAVNAMEPLAQILGEILLDKSMKIPYNNG